MDSTGQIAAAKSLVLRAGDDLHARPAARFVRVARTFECDVTLSCGGAQADGKSIIGLVTLGVCAGTTVTIAARGADADRALEVLRRVLAGETGGPGAAGR